MPGFLLHIGASVQCAHGGQATPVVPNLRVRVAGQQAVTLASIYTVTGCPYVPPAPGPCVSAQWIVGASRVLAGGVPVLLRDSQAVCVPTGAPLTVLVTQIRVRGV
ncbi:hypothetical protein ACH4OY_13770 [Micromonospora rubida]|uniref:DUF4280 domain-containing protein n=1 Tax=Micromonospora rubida TaxID=2697657 RepID=A0ABW7SJ73_9ACTN